MKCTGSFWGILSGFLVALTSCSGNINDSTVFQAHTVLVSLTDSSQLLSDDSILAFDDSGSPAEDECSNRLISGDGRYVVFLSKTIDVVTNVSTTLGITHIYVRDMVGRRTVLIDISSSGGESDSDSDPNNSNTVRNRNPSISKDGRYVAFDSNAVNLLASGNTTFGRTHVYRRDLFLGVTQLVSLAHTSGAEGGTGLDTARDACISEDGRWIAFESNMTNLITPYTKIHSDFDVFLRDMNLFTGNHTILVSHKDNLVSEGGVFESRNPSISGDGSRIVFETTYQFAPDPDGGGPLLSPDQNGTYDVYMKDVNTATLTYLSISDKTGEGGDGASLNASISGNGLRIGFKSFAQNFDPQQDSLNDGDIYLRDLSTSKTVLLTPKSNSTTTGDDPDLPVLNEDGRYVVFQSGAVSLVDGDTNNALDIFLYDVERSLTTRISISTFGSEILSGNNRAPSISPDGKYVAWQSNAADIVDNDLNGRWDVFIRGPLPVE